MTITILKHNSPRICRWLPISVREILSTRLPFCVYPSLDSILCPWLILGTSNDLLCLGFLKLLDSEAEMQVQKTAPSRGRQTIQLLKAWLQLLIGEKAQIEIDETVDYFLCDDTVAKALKFPFDFALGNYYHMPFATRLLEDFADHLKKRNASQTVTCLTEEELPYPIDYLKKTALFIENWYKEWGYDIYGTAIFSQLVTFYTLLPRIEKPR